MLIIFIYTIILSPINGFIGFDCGGQRMNITSVSLLSIDNCDLKNHAHNSSEVYIQLLQLSEYNYAEVMQCKVQVLRRIQYCGMHSHISAEQRPSRVPLGRQLREMFTHVPRRNLNHRKLWNNRRIETKY